MSDDREPLEIRVVSLPMSPAFVAARRRALARREAELSKLTPAARDLFEEMERRVDDRMLGLTDASAPDIDRTSTGRNAERDGI